MQTCWEGDQKTPLTVLCLAAATLFIFSASLLPPSCAIPVKLMSILTYVIAWADLAFIHYVKNNRSAGNYLLVALGGVVFACGLAYLIAAQILNCRVSPDCSPTWSRFSFWIGVLATLIAYFMPFSAKVAAAISYYLKKREIESIEEHCESVTLDLYSREVGLERAVLDDSESKHLIKHLQEDPLTPEELEKALSFIGHVRGNTKVDSAFVCCKCKQEVATGCSYIILPECYHEYDMECFRAHCADDKTRCAACKTHIRRAILYKIHRYSPNKNGDIF